MRYIPMVPEPEWLSSEEMRLWRSFVDASVSVIHNVETDLKEESGLSVDDYEVLVFLSEAPEQRLPVADLSERLGSSRTRLALRIDRMAKRGLVAIQTTGTNDGAAAAVITKMGHKTLVKAAPYHVLSVREHFIKHVKPEEVTPTANALERLKRAE